MAPYTGLSLSGSFASSTKGYRDSKDDVVFQLTERLREREDELQQVCHERDRLEDQLKLRGNLPVHLDVAYEELLTHCKEREEEHKKETEQHLREKFALENRCLNLEEKLEEQTRMIDAYEQEVIAEKDEMEKEIRKCHHRLELAVEEIQEKEQRMMSLEKMVDRLKDENDRLLDSEEENKAVIARIGKRVEDIKELEMLNFRLEERLGSREELLVQKDEDLNNYIELHQDELKNMDLRLHKVIDLQRKDLQQRDREIIMLKRYIEKYEDILDEAEHVSHEQRRSLRAREDRIGELSMAIERRENADFLSQFDKMCTF
ncbi:hypothetical protein ACHAWT_008122 [Skeletonema menzelii]